MWISKTPHHIKIKIKILNLCQEPPLSSKAPNQDLKDMVVICTFKIKKKSKIRKIGVSKTNHNIQIKIMIPNPSQEHPASSKAPNQDLKDIEVLCFFKIKMVSQQFYTWVYQRPVTISKSRSRSQTPARNLQHPPKPPVRT